MAKKKTSGPLLPPIDVPLLEPSIEGDTEGGHGGMGLRHTERDLIVYLIAPAGGVAAGSVALLYWGDRNVAVTSTPIREGEENLARIPLRLPVGRIVEFWTGPVFGKLRRRSGNESFTEELNLRVRLNRPGGVDPDGDTEGHQRLVYVVPPEILFNGVSEAAALAGVRIIIRHWLHMGAYDLILLVWGSQRVEHRVQPGEVGRDITLTVDYATISAAGNNRLTRVAYQVRDAGGNLPDERARWSALSLIDVHLNEVRPEAPWLEFPKTGTVINLADLVSSDVLIQCWITSAEVAAYSQLTLIWAGTDSEGNSIPHIIARAFNAPGVQTFEIPNALVAAIANGNASVHVLFQKGTIEHPSQKLYLDIVGELVRWPAPTIDEDLGGHIEPDVAATVRFPLQGSWPANGYLEVIFRASSPDNTIEHRVGREVDDIAPTPGGDMLFIVYPDELVRFDGHLVEVFYAHTRPGNRPQESQRFQVIVGQLQRTMPAPIIEKAISGQLNPDDIGTHAKVFAPFTQTKRADWIRMYWIGAHAHTEVAVQVSVDGATTEHSIESHYVTNNLNESVTVFYTLLRGDEPPRYSLITEVLISRGLGDLPAPTLLEAQVTGPDTADLDPLKVQSGTKLVVSYVGMRGSDSIKITMAGAGDGGSPDMPAKPGNEALQKVEFDISKAAIHANIRNVATTVKFNYVVTRNSVPKTSGTLTVTVKPLALEELAKTVLQINQADATTKILDLSALTGDATTRVGVWPFITTPYPVWLRLLGRTAGNVVHDHLVYNGAGWSAVNVNWVSSGQIEATIPRTYLDGLGHGTKLRIEFKAAVSRSKVESQAITFPMVEYTVNTLPLGLPVPTLIQAIGSGAFVTLDPMNARSGAQVEVRYSPMFLTDAIHLRMQGTPGEGTPTIKIKPGRANGVVTFDIPSTAIAANIANVDKTFTLKYDRTRDGKVEPSYLLTVTMMRLSGSKLPRALINSVVHNGILNTRRNIYTLTVAPWPFRRTTDRVWVTLHCDDVVPRDLNVISDKTFSSSSGVSTNVSAEAVAWLKSCPHGATLSISLEILFRDTTTSAPRDPITFPITYYTINNV